MKLSDKILTLRKTKGMSQEELAEKLNISRQTVSRWEMGSSQPEAANVFRLSQLFGVSADFLLNDELDIPPATSTATIRKRKTEKIIAICIAGLGLLGNFIIYILSRFTEVMVPVVTYQNGTKFYTWRSDIKDYSYRYFIMEYNLEFLTALFYIMLAAGLIIIFKDKISPIYQKVRYNFLSIYKKIRKH